MDFALTEEQEMIAETARAFFRDNASSERTRAAMAGEGIDRSLWSDFAGELGLAGVCIPDEFGGAGLGMIEMALVAEAAGAWVAALPFPGHAMLAQAIVAGGSEEQKGRWLAKLAAGKVIGTAVHADSIKSGRETISTVLPFVPYGASASVMLVCSPQGAWIVDRTGEGVSMTAQVTMDQTRPLARVRLQDVAAERLRDGHAGRKSALAAGWTCLAAEALGGAQAALDRTVQYSLERVQFGRQIGSFQAYKHRLADLKVDIEQARSAVYWAASALDGATADADLAVHAAKSFCADTFATCAGNMIQLHGGIGFTWEHDAHLYFKRARSISSMLGDSAWHRERVAQIILDQAA